MRIFYVVSSKLTLLVFYYTFGQSMPARSWSGVTEQYRYGNNGVERNPQLFEGAYETYYRLYDSRIGRWLSKDPLTFPDESPFVGMANNPITYADPFGDKITYGGFKTWVRVQYKRATDGNFRKEFNALKAQYKEKATNQKGEKIDKEKELKILIDKKSHLTLDEAVKGHNTDNGGTDVGGKDNLRYNGNVDKIVISEQDYGDEKYHLTVEPTKTIEFNFQLRFPNIDFDKWTIKPLNNDWNLMINFSTLSKPKSTMTNWTIEIKNPAKNQQGGDGDWRYNRNPSYSLDHTNGWGTGTITFQIEALGIPRIYSVERRIFGPYRNKTIFKDYSGKIDIEKKINHNISISGIGSINK